MVISSVSHPLTNSSEASTFCSHLGNTLEYYPKVLAAVTAYTQYAASSISSHSFVKSWEKTREAITDKITSSIPFIGTSTKSWINYLFPIDNVMHSAFVFRKEIRELAVNAKDNLLTYGGILAAHTYKIWNSQGIFKAALIAPKVLVYLTYLGLKGSPQLILGLVRTSFIYTYMTKRLMAPYTPTLQNIGKATVLTTLLATTYQFLASYFYHSNCLKSDESAMSDDSQKKTFKAHFTKAYDDSKEYLYQNQIEEEIAKTKFLALRFNNQTLTDQLVDITKRIVLGKATLKEKAYYSGFYEVAKEL